MIRRKPKQRPPATTRGRRLKKPTHQVEAALENVVGMSTMDIEAVKVAMQANGPDLLCEGEISFALRPRLWWTTWKLIPRGREMLIPTEKGMKLQYWGRRPAPPWPLPWKLGGVSHLPTLTCPQDEAIPERRDAGSEHSTEMGGRQVPLSALPVRRKGDAEGGG